MPYGATSGAPVGTDLEVGIYLVGWSDESVPLSAEVVGRSYSAIETALYVYALPVEKTKSAAGLDLDMQGSDYTFPWAASLWDVESEDWYRLDVGWGQ